MIQAEESLLLFQEVLGDEVGQALCAYAAEPGTPAYVRLARALWAAGTSLRAHLIARVLRDENAFTRAAAAGGGCAGPAGRGPARPAGAGGAGGAGARGAGGAAGAARG